MARQREGDVSTFHFIDNMARAIRHTGRIIIDLIPKVYNTARIVRVIGEDGTQEARKVNQEYPVGQDETGQAIMALHQIAEIGVAAVSVARRMAVDEAVLHVVADPHVGRHGRVRRPGPRAGHPAGQGRGL